MQNSYRQIRNAKGLNQQELSNLCGLSIATISHFETGDLPNPSARTKRKLAEAYGVTIAEIDAACRQGSEPVAA